MTAILSPIVLILLYVALFLSLVSAKDSQLADLSYGEIDSKTSIKK